MMAKYNVGDKVRVTAKDESIPYGTVLTVRKGPEGLTSGGNYYFNENRKIVLGDDLELIPQYKTEKRKANVGERILITKAEDTRGEYKNGDVATVSHKHALFDSLTYVNEWERSVRNTEYEVIVETPTPPKPKKSERITALESQVADLQAKVEALEAQSKPAPTHSFADSFPLTAKFEREATLVKTPNQQRADVIKRAQAFVAKYEGILENDEIIRIEFVVNPDKRTVVAIVHGLLSKKVKRRAVAKCDPDDVFNADIGKAIALARALGVDVPEEFVKAVQPTEVVVGHIVSRFNTYGRAIGEMRVRKVRELRDVEFSANPKNSHEINGAYGYCVEYGDVITDDTDAVYK